MLKEKPIINISYNHPLVLEYKYLIRKKYQKISEVRELKSNRFLSKCIIKNVVNLFTTKLTFQKMLLNWWNQDIVLILLQMQII